ncbi:hypothetical protein QVD17_14927 [Tagetes erecta]|uniref:Uncharacterized protein n=1 Tax=Tagetes erecta TaxID=13708 RepID=A0AAD8NZ20_TARER|nr:hypothetical protein QVD17_14927 [Tagetes erecta]
MIKYPIQLSSGGRTNTIISEKGARNAEKLPINFQMVSQIFMAPQHGKNKGINFLPLLNLKHIICTRKYCIWVHFISFHIFIPLLSAPFRTVVLNRI